MENLIALLNIITIVMGINNVTFIDGEIPLKTVDWSDLGYPILNEKIQYPYLIEMPDRTTVALFDDGPDGLNEGDVLKLQLSTAAYVINGSWYQIGASFGDGKYLRYSNEYVQLSELCRIEFVEYNNVSSVQAEINRIAEEIGDDEVRDEDVIRYYETILEHKGKFLNKDKSEKYSTGGGAYWLDTNSDLSKRV